MNTEILLSSALEVYKKHRKKVFSTAFRRDVNSHLSLTDNFMKFSHPSKIWREDKAYNLNIAGRLPEKSRDRRLWPTMKWNN